MFSSRSWRYSKGKNFTNYKFLKGLEDESHRLPQSTFIQTISGDYATEDSAGALPRSVYNPTDIDVILKPDFDTMRVVPWYDDPTAVSYTHLTLPTKA